MSGDIYENTPSGRSAALAAVDNDESRLWIDGPVIRILDMIEDVSSGVVFDAQLAQLVPFLQSGAGTELGCRWHTDAEKREIAYALRALAEKLDPDPTKI